MNEKLIHFSQKRKGHLSFTELRQLVINSGSYDPDSAEINAAIELQNLGYFREALDLLLKSRDNLLLSPSYHRHLSYLFQQLNDLENCDLEYALAKSCFEGITSTGDGTEKNPYLVLRISDEKDTLKHLRYKSLIQKLIKKDDKHFDVFECENNNDCWFDISDFFK